MTSVAVSDARPWAFWSPASDEAIEAALDLAELRPGEEFLDVGCGDGRVLLAAARRGARVRGIEINPGLADEAARAVVDAGYEGRIDQGNMFETDLRADVVYAYLTQAVLGELGEALGAAGAGGRLVSPRYRVLQWREDRSANGCFRYNLPARPAGPPESHGWGPRGILLVVPPLRRCLVSLVFAACAGDFEVVASPALRRALRVRTAPELSGQARTVAVDVQAEPCRAGGAVMGQLAAQGEELALAVVFSETGQGRWDFGPDDGGKYASAVRTARIEARKGVRG